MGSREMYKCPHCDFKVPISDIEKEDGLCPECGQPLLASTLRDDFDETDEDVDSLSEMDFDEDEDGYDADEGFEDDEYDGGFEEDFENFDEDSEDRY